jgi:hypothetical protein
VDRDRDADDCARMRIVLALLLAALASGCQSQFDDWSCAAYCVTEYHCTTNGDSSWKSESITSDGATAAEAFRKLSGQCSDAVTSLVTHMQCASGKYVAEGATVATSCAKD